jgi:hypothetical protein
MGPVAVTVGALREGAHRLVCRRSRKKQPAGFRSHLASGAANGPIGIPMTANDGLTPASSRANGPMVIGPIVIDGLTPLAAGATGPLETRERTTGADWLGRWVLA